MKIIKLVIIIGLVSMSGQAFAYCRAPDPPSVPSSNSKPKKPKIPYCINEYENTHTCSDWIIQNYKIKVRRYTQQVQHYVTELKVYADKTISFAREAQDYIVCEIKDTQ